MTGGEKVALAGGLTLAAVIGFLALSESGRASADVGLEVGSDVDRHPLYARPAHASAAYHSVCSGGWDAWILNPPSESE